MIRKLLVASVACAALAVSACGKKEEAKLEETAPPAAAEAPAAVPATNDAAATNAPAAAEAPAANAAAK